MKRKLTAILIIVCVLLAGCSKDETFLAYNSSAQTSNLSNDSLLYQAPLNTDNLSVIPKDFKSKANPRLTAGAELLVDITDHKALYGKNIYKKLYPASITKLMTAYVALKYGDLKSTITVSKNAANIAEPGAQKCGLQEGDKLSMETCLNSFLVFSGNDAGIAIAEQVSGSVDKFVSLMNSEAKKLGASHTNFVNPHGLHNKNHYTTAYDIYVILNAIIKNKDFLKIVGQKQYIAEYVDKNDNPVKKVFESTDQYLTGAVKTPKGLTILGGKTGTTDQAGCCLTLYSKANNGHEYISVVLKAYNHTDLYNQMTTLFSYIGTN